MNKIVRKWEDFCKKNVKIITENDGTRVPLFEEFSVHRDTLFTYKNYYISGYLECVYHFENNESFRGPSLPFAIIIVDAPSAQKALEFFYKVMDNAEDDYNKDNKNYPFGARKMSIMDEVITEIRSISYQQSNNFIKYYDIPEYIYNSKY